MIGAAASGTGILLAVQARTALGAATCLSPSAVVSGNQSTQPDALNCTGGATPTVWKLQTSLLLWPTLDAIAPTFTATLVDSSTGCNGSHDVSADPHAYMSDLGTRVSAILPGGPSDLSVWEVLAFPAKYVDGDLMAALLAAWFNAKYYAPDYPIKRWHVTEMWTERGDYCPASITCSPGSGMSVTAMLNYIVSTFDKTSTDIAVCAANGNTAQSAGTTSSGTKKK